MNDDAAAGASSTAGAAQPQRQALQHRLSAQHVLPAASELEVVTLHSASSTFSCAPVQAASSAAGVAAPSSAAAASSSPPTGPPLRFLKRRSDVTRTGGSALSSLLADSDLVTQVYEGGFAVWECAIDLILFMQRQMPSSAAAAASASASAPSASLSSLLFPSGLSGLRVVELGCGHAFPALFALLHGASYVALQDFNAEVLEQATLDNALLNASPNVAPLLLNPHASAADLATAAAAVSSASQQQQAQHVVSERCGFFSGDWSDPALASLLLPAGESSRYDLLLTSDTLYSVAYYPALWSLIQRLLSPKGRALVAAKRYYFGIGGSTRSFADLVAQTPGGGEWTCTVVDTVEDGKSNIREILLVQRTQAQQ
jgi:predicted nicotinamide N-methyase